MASIKKDDNKAQWEDTEFPLVCETCLGDNPYIRMTKEPHGKACKICETPFTVFAWQAGTRGRLKRVEICRNCARTKNVCQVCIYDLQYGLPVQVRDRILAEEGGANAGRGGAGAGSTVPQSDANRAWFSAQEQRAIEQGAAGAVPGTKAHLKLQSMARMEPRYERNLPKLCSFFARGECDRGTNCPFRHEMPTDRNDPLAKQNTKDRFYGTADPVAEKMLAGQKARQEKRREEARARGTDGDERAVATLYCRYSDRVGGNPRGQGEEQSEQRLPPGPPMTEAALRDKFYSYGEIVSVRIPGREAQAAFVEYTTGDATELAIASTNRTTLNGRQLYVSWARVPKRGNEAAGSMAAQGQGVGGVGGAVRPVLPPGYKPGADGAAGFKGSTLPSGFAPVRPSAAVAAAAAARKAAPGAGPRPAAPGVGGVPRPGAVGVPRPGGGPIRRAGAGVTRGAAPKPYYASADPGRLGTRAPQEGS
jgi:pre-mRNA-splicing factor RBM22/SLT11